MIATAIIDAIDPDGMLTLTVDEITESVASFTSLGDGIEIETDEVIAVLKRIQHFDPTGIAARDLGECLSLQLMALPSETPWRGKAVELVENYLDILGARDFATLKRKTKLSEEDLACVIELVHPDRREPRSNRSCETVGGVPAPPGAERARRHDL